MIRTAPAGVRQTSRGFYGVGFPHVVVDCFVEQTNKVLIHYGCPSKSEDEDIAGVHYPGDDNLTSTLARVIQEVQTVDDTNLA